MSISRRIIQSRQRRRKQNRTGTRLLLRWLLVAALVLASVAVLLTVTALGSIVGVYAFYVRDLPEPGQITIVEDNFETTRIYDRSGQVLIYEIIDPLGGDRQWLPLQDIPPNLRNATVAIEDASFYDRPQVAGVTLGVNLEGIARAFVNNLSGETLQGGSSITQQLVKNVLIDPEERLQRTLGRKIKELILATEIESSYDKDQILEWYLNTNFYGNLAYGIEAASQVYFDKTASQLTLAESAMLSAIPQFPAINPIDNPEAAKLRQQIVLEKMVDEGYITQQQASAALAEDIQTQRIEERFNIIAPHFSIYARKQLEEMFGPSLIFRGGLTVYTTLDLDLQYQVECVARTHLTRLSGSDPNFIAPTSINTPCLAADYLPPLPASLSGTDHQASNAAIVVIRVQTGEILALQGSLDYYDESIDGNFNAALGQRQPGSAFKPLTYLTAFAEGFTPATMTLDVRTAFYQEAVQPYVPENFDSAFHGPQSIRAALANSYNIPAVQVTEWVGVDSVIRTAHAMGIDTLTEGLDQYGLSLTLGGGEVTLLDLTYAYSVFANMGRMSGTPTPLDQRRDGFRTLEPVAILRVEDRDGNILWEYGQRDTFATNDILSPSLAYLINDILSDEVARRPAMGDNSPLQLASRPAAAKTGTTNDIRDTWTVGYTPLITTGVWVGNNDNTPMLGISGLSGAAPIWHAVMEYSSLNEPAIDWQRPPDITEVVVCRISGQLPTPYCPTTTEIFIAGTEPTAYDTVFQPFRINKETSLLATVYTPPELIEERVFQILPPEAADWVRNSGLPQPPIEYDIINAPIQFGEVAIITPAPYSYVKSVVPIHGNATGNGFSFYRLDYGEGLNPTEWIQIGQDSGTARTDDELGIWDTRFLEGLYSLRLTIVRSDSSFTQSIVQVTADNTPPIVQLLYPTNQQAYSLSNDEYVIIQPVVEDNLSMDRVEIYVDEQLVATSTVSPFNERWIISSIGSHVIHVRAYDAAGNTALSNQVVIEVVN